MWNGVVAVVAAAVLAAVLVALRRLPDLPTRFLILALWLRFVFAAYHEITYKPLAGGLSMTALATIGVAVVALWLARGELRLRFVFPLYALLAIVVVSGLKNALYMPMADYLARYLYMIGLALLTYRALRLFEANRVLKAILLTTLIPVALQWFSVVFGVYKINEDDGVSRSYIGGFHHESDFSVVLLLVLCLVSLIRWRNRFAAVIFMTVAMRGILLAAYRTTMIAGAPVFALALFTLATQFLKPALRPLILVGGLAIGVTGTAFIDRLLPDRLSDVTRVFNEGPKFLTPPQELAVEDRRIFTGRFYIWSRWIHDWRLAPLEQRLIGLGPGVGTRRFGKDSHNFMVNWLHGFGLIGLSATLAVKAFYLITALRLADRALAIRLTACFVGFSVAGLATSVFYSIEGLILYALLLGRLWAAAAARRSAQLAPVGTRATA